MEAQNMDSVINLTKQNIWKMLKKEKCIRINNKDIEEVNKLKYLGYNITNNKTFHLQ